MASESVLETGTVHGGARRLRVTNGTGLHLRAAAEIVKVAHGFQATITLEYRGVQADARSILSVACLAASAGSTVSVTAVGPDAAEALETLAALFARGFGEGTMITRTVGASMPCPA
ncbi:MAG: HPr family phosphocarrier protein [Verrucomicrobia bacterium]|nr:HPr family phosphocarrier protein [Verrucomicrobiota bacterium]